MYVSSEEPNMASEAEMVAAKKAVEQVEVHAADRVNLIGNRQIYELFTGWVVDEIVRAALDAAEKARAGIRQPEVLGGMDW
jgi:hypothetical protein